MSYNLQNYFKLFPKKKILVLGDFMVDKFLYGSVSRISPEAPVPILNLKNEEIFPGGAGNVVRNLISLGIKVSTLTVTGYDEEALILKKYFHENNVDYQGLFLSPSRNTGIKTRVIASNQQLIRIDKETVSKISAEFEEKVTSYIEKNMKEFDLLIISDYNKGVCTQKVLECAIANANDKNIPVIIDPKPENIQLYKNAFLITPNLKEFEIIVGKEIKEEKELSLEAIKLIEKLNLKYILVTRGKDGMSLFSKDNEKQLNIKSFAQEVYDVSGAGDTVISTLSAMIAGDAEIKDACLAANYAASIVVSKVGTSTVTCREIVNEFKKHQGDENTGLVLSLSDLKNQIAKLRRNNKKIVFTNGCFDLLHAGHISYLKEASKLGDFLVIGLNSDSSVKKLKGDDRPLLSEEERSSILSALSFVDFVTIFNGETPLELIKEITPDVLVKGGDYNKDQIVGREIVEGNGGKVVTIEFVKGKSTSNIIEKIKTTLSR
ncbi:MAG: D-glycero-beta-D-manno-heptose-7-phosphate kinase [Pseudomonadota bacterium]